MKKEFVVSKVEAPQDGGPYICIVLTDIKGNFTRTKRQQGFAENPFGIATIPITSLDDLNNLPKKISDAINAVYGSSDNNNAPYDSTTLKMTQQEFQELGIKKGDKITLEIKISNSDIVNGLHNR
jgi:hypothetical protein